MIYFFFASHRCFLHRFLECRQWYIFCRFLAWNWSCFVPFLARHRCCFLRFFCADPNEILVHTEGLVARCVHHRVVKVSGFPSWRPPFDVPLVSVLTCIPVWWPFSCDFSYWPCHRCCDFSFWWPSFGMPQVLLVFLQRRFSALKNQNDFLFGNKWFAPKAACASFDSRFCCLPLLNMLRL